MWQTSLRSSCYVRSQLGLGNHGPHPCNLSSVSLSVTRRSSPQLPQERDREANTGRIWCLAYSRPSCTQSVGGPTNTSSNLSSVSPCLHRHLTWQTPPTPPPSTSAATSLHCSVAGAVQGNFQAGEGGHGGGGQSMARMVRGCVPAVSLSKTFYYLFMYIT